MLNFKDASLRSVLEYLSEAAGLIVVQEATVEGRITVMSLKPVSIDEAVSMLNTVLKEKGYTAVRVARTLRIVALDQAKKTALPVRSGNDPSKIELSDQMITQVIPLRAADATQLKRDLTTLIPSYADLSANDATNSLILTDTQTNVRRFVEIVSALDTQTATVSEVRVYQLKYANAANAARLINDLFKADQPSGPGASPFGAIRQFMFGGGGGGPFGGGGGPFGGGGRGGGGPRGEPGEFGRREGGEGGRRDGGESPNTINSRQQQQKVTASSDERTNTLVVSGPPEHRRKERRQLDGRRTRHGLRLQQHGLFQRQFQRVREQRIRLAEFQRPRGNGLCFRRRRHGAPVVQHAVVGHRSRRTGFRRLR
ncbi:MAG: hypothetical protein NT049_12850 [Planctomycetota bacterium]|nr:hypothetical protein [Planctomycetota bacterium]